MQIETMIVSMFATNCYLVSCPQSREAMVIDPGAEGKRIIERIRELGLLPQMIVNTHGHIDHIGANSKLKQEWQIPVMLSEKDLDVYNNPGFGLGLVLKKQPQPEKYMSEGDIISFGHQSLKVLETPGHTDGGICLVGESMVFCGDTLFAGSIGRTDLAGGSYPTLMESISNKLLTLPPATVVYPGHGPATTIGFEKENNPFLSGL